MKPARFARLAAFVVTALLWLPSIAGLSEDAVAAYENGDYASALRLWLELAEQGDASAQMRLGRMYRDGRGVVRDDEQAVKWFRAAAEQGNASAQTSIGYMYEQGRGVPRDYTEALQWFRKAAQQGYAAAQNNLGAMYLKGRGVNEDEAEAAQWFRQAASQGDASAQTNLGEMYQSARGGLPRDDTQAVAWYRRAAEQGVARAQNNLGVMYRDGRGVENDDAAAVAWFRKAAEQGYAESQNNLGLMYEGGRGVANDETEAARWYRKAADRGNSSARDNLGRIAKKEVVATVGSGTSTCKMAQIDQWLIRFVRDRMLVIDGAINGQKVGILLDTGAMRTMIFRPVAARLGLTMHRVGGRWISGVGGDSIVESADVSEFKIGESSRRNWQMMVAGEHEPGDGIGVLLGEDFFQNADVEFDLANRVVRLFQPGKCPGASLAYWTAGGAMEVEIEAVNPTRPRIVMPVKVNGLPIVALFDTGASTSILDKVIARRLGVGPDTPGVVAVDRVSGIGKESLDVWVGPFQSFEIGNEAIKTTSIPFGDIGNIAQMVLGTDFLLTHRLLVSHTRRKMYFTYAGGPVFQRSNAPSER